MSNARHFHNQYDQRINKAPLHWQFTIISHVYSQSVHVRLNEGITYSVNARITRVNDCHVTTEETITYDLGLVTILTVPVVNVLG